MWVLFFGFRLGRKGFGRRRVQFPGRAVTQGTVEPHGAEKGFYLVKREPTAFGAAAGRPAGEAFGLEGGEEAFNRRVPARFAGALGRAADAGRAAAGVTPTRGNRRRRRMHQPAEAAGFPRRLQRWRKPNPVNARLAPGAVAVIYLAPHAARPVSRDATITRGHPAGAGSAGDLLPLFCLAPHGVFPAPSLAAGPVGSYPAISPLPAAVETAPGGIFSVTLSVIPGLGQGMPALSDGVLPSGVRTFLCPDVPDSDGLPRRQLYRWDRLHQS